MNQKITINILMLTDIKKLLFHHSIHQKWLIFLKKLPKYNKKISNNSKKIFYTK